MGVANGRGYQEVGVASGWNLWVWLVSVVVRRYIIDILIIIITFPYSTCISSFILAASSLFLYSFLKCFFVLVNYRTGTKCTLGRFVARLLLAKV